MIRPFVHSRDNANIAFYVEQEPGRHFAEVLCAALTKVSGEWRAADRPVYYFTVYLRGRGPVAHFDYQPPRPHRGRLSDRAVTRIIRRELASDR